MLALPKLVAVVSVTPLVQTCVLAHNIAIYTLVILVLLFVVQQSQTCC